MSSFAEGIHALMLKQADPDHMVTKQAMQGFVQQQQQDVLERKASTISSVSVLLAKAKDNGESQSVIDAYERLLAQASAS